MDGLGAMTFSERFGKTVHLTQHVIDRMKKRDVDPELKEMLILNFWKIS
jgi:hypothetical protein